MMKKKIIVKSGNLQEAVKEFINVWQQAEKNKFLQSSLEKITFTDQSLLFKTLTPKRLEILEYTHQCKGISIRALAKAVARDYKNVYQDVKMLHQLGLMLKHPDSQKYFVPWDVLVTEILLTRKLKKQASVNDKNNRRAHG